MTSVPSVPCPLCKNDTTDFFKWRLSYRIGTCANCGVLFGDPMPTDAELLAFYQGFTYRQPDPTRLDALVRIKRDELVSLFGAEESLSGKRFLDYGGGTGVTYGAAQSLGMNSDFFEIDQQATDFVKAHLGLSDDKAFATADALQATSYDFIVADNVIEHDPLAHDFVRRIYSLLKPGGVAVIKTPHARSAELWFYPLVSIVSRNGYMRQTWTYNGLAAAMATVAQRRWNCDPPRHVYSFSRESLSHLAIDANVATHSIEHYHPPLLEYSLINTFLLTRPRTAKAVVAWLLALALAPFELMSKAVQLVFRRLFPLSAAGVTLRLTRKA